MEDVNLMESVFEAISAGDADLLEGCIQQMTIESVLEFERLYGESPLHLCVKIGGISHLPVVRRLLASGLFDSAGADGDGRTMLEVAYEGEDSELLEALIKVTTEEMDDATACYSMLRHDSLAIFKSFLAVKQFMEEQEFQHIASALIQLNAKNVHLSEDLYIYALWKLSDYGFRNLSGNWPGTKDPNEWKHHVEIVQECWDDIAAHHDTGLYADIDDQFLQRTQTLHNSLYFLKHKQFLAYLPMQEAIFCVAIFLSIYRNAAQFQEYRLMINKCLVIEFMRMISRQLTLVKTYLERTETDLLEIVREVETKDATAKGSLMGDLLAKIESSQLPNKEHVVKQLKERVSTIGSSNKDSLIKDMMDKLKRIDKRWVEQKMEELKALEKVSKEHLIEQIGKRLRHVSHPQNVANRLMGDWKKGKATEPIVADIISGESFDLSHLLQQDRRTKRKLLKCYSATKQHYSLHKIMYYLERMASTAKRNVTTPTTHVDIACMKRTVQVLGEAIKNTTNSANMPGKAEAAVHSMLTSLFPDMNKQLREVFSHSISLKKLLIGDGNDRRLCNTFRSHLGMVRTAFQLLYVVSVAEIRHAFYGFMRRCRSLRELRSLALYVGDMEELEERQLACYQQVQVYFEEAKDTFAELEQEPIGQRPQFRHLQKELEVKRSIVSDLGRHFDENAAFSYGELRRACLSGDSLDAIRKVLDWKLTMTWANKFFKKVRASWHSNHVESVTMEWIDNRLLAYNPSVIAGILKNSSISMDCAEEFDYIANTREIVKDFAVQGEDTIGEEALQQLNKRLKPYYNNIFFVDNKWKVLEAFCKERKLPWNKERSRELVKRDQAHLQQLYDERRGQLRSILEQNGINTLDGLTKRLFALPTSMLVAIEYIQLELCEMLYAVGYFGDSFHYVKHLIPMIQGKNYRNFLAHDALSYNLLTDSSMEKIVINAFVLANRVVRLFGGGNGAKAVHLTFPTLRETIAWAKRQTQLLKAFQAGDIKQMHCLVKSGGEIKKARFCCTRNPTYLAADYFGLSALVNPDRADKSMVEYLSRYFAGFHDRCNDPAYQLEMALKLRDFQAVFDRTIGTGDRVIREELLDWPELMKRVRKTDLFVHLIAAVNRGNILKKLIEHGNEQGVREMLPYFEQFNVSENRGPLGDAMLYCVRSITDLLLHRTTVPHPAIILLAIILHWNDIFIVMMNKSDIDQATYQFLLKTAAQARNYTAGVYLLETRTLARFIPTAFEQCCLSAVRAGEVNLLKHLLVRCPGENMISLAKILHEAAVRKRWKCVEVLLREENAPIDALFRDGLKEESCTFLVLVKYGQYHLLRNIVTIEREIFGTLATHPFTVAIRNGMASERMIRTLQRLGFDWLDSSSILHEAIHSKHRSSFETILKRVDVVCSLQPATHHDHFQLALSVLYRWKMIAFVEESKTYETSLFRAVQNKDYTMVEQLLSWARRARTMSAGALGGIVFERDSVYICSGKRSAEQPLWNTGDSCEEMVVCMETCALLEDMKWQQFTVQAQAIPITFHVLTVEEEILEPMSEDDATFTLSKPDSLLDCLKDILAFVNSKLTQCAIVFASFCTASGMKHFWQIEQTNCMYDVLSLADDNHHSDLSDTVNYRDMRGETPLHHCFPNDTLEMVKLLVENGANPLLADHSGMAALHVSLLNSQDYAVGRYLFDQCVARDLRNEKGCSVLELDDGNGANRLIHTAVMVGRRDIIARLLQHGIDVSVVNSYGVTPALLAAGTNVYQSYRIVGMILEHDASTIDAIDAKGQTLVQYAARVNSIELLRVVLQYKPNLLLASDSLTALGMAILLSHVEFAKCLLSYAREHDIRGLTRFGEEDFVVLSLICNDQELSRGLLEYELGHTLTEVDERDLPRLRSVLDCSLPGMEDVSVARVIERKGLTESANFLEELLVLVTSIADQ